jgi:hypothetical protein
MKFKHFSTTFRSSMFEQSSMRLLCDSTVTAKGRM